MAAPFRPPTLGQQTLHWRRWLGSASSALGIVRLGPGDHVFSLQRLRWFSLIGLLLIGILLTTGCSLPQVSAESRLFLNPSLTYLAQYPLPSLSLTGNAQESSPPPNITALDYSRSRDRLYALTNDRLKVYTLTLTPPPLDAQTANSLPDYPLGIESITSLQDTASPPAIAETGLAVTPRNTLFIVGEQVGEQNRAASRLSEFDLTAGDWQQTLPLPQQYGPSPEPSQPWGIQPHQGLKAIALGANGDRLFIATEAPLQQDIAPPDLAYSSPRYSRLLHYWIGEPEPLLISEHLYPLDASNPDASNPAPHPEFLDSRLLDIALLDNAGHFLGLEQTYSPAKGYSTIIYEFVTGVATDTSQIRKLPPNPTGIAPILKKALLRLEDLPASLGSINSMTLGPYLANGDRTVILTSQRELEKTTPASPAPATQPAQLILLRLVQNDG